MALPKNDYSQEVITDSWLNEIARLAASVSGVDVSGDSDVTLTASQYQARVLSLTGTLTGNIDVILPDDAGRVWAVLNGTTGSYTVTCTTAGGSGITVAQGTRALLACDGTDILRLTPDTTATGTLYQTTVGPDSDSQHTLPNVASDTVALLAAAQTLTNKTLTAPTIQGTVGAGTGLTLPALTQSGTVTLSEGVNVVAGTTTGTKLGTASTQKLGFWNATPIVRPSAYTQSYATASRTLAAYTSDPESSAYTGAADGEAKLADLNALRVAYENLRAHHESLAQVVNQILDDLQSMGLLA